MKTQIIFAVLLMSQMSLLQASFSQGQQRYISGHEFSQRIADIGIRLDNGNYPGGCLALVDRNDESVLSLGANPPALGRPLFTNPTAGTVQVLAECVLKSMVLINGPYSEAELGAFVSDDFMAPIIVQFPNYRLKRDALSLRWSQIPAQAQYTLVADLVEKIIGTDVVIEDYGLVVNAETFRHEILKQINEQMSNSTLMEIIQKIVVTLVLRDEFLSY